MYYLGCVCIILMVLLFLLSVRKWHCFSLEQLCWKHCRHKPRCRNNPQCDSGVQQSIFASNSCDCRPVSPPILSLYHWSVANKLNELIRQTMNYRLLTGLSSKFHSVDSFWCLLDLTSSFTYALVYKLVNVSQTCFIRLEISSLTTPSMRGLKCSRNESLLCRAIDKPKSIHFYLFNVL